MEDSNATRKTFVVPDIKPLDLYDSTRGKICASVGWLLAKSYGNAENVPAELLDPFYCDQYEQEHLKPPVTRLLLSSELYCRAYSLLAGGPEAGGPPADNAALLRLLASRGLAPEDQGAPVADADLRRKPIKMSAHLALMDALMAVGAMETVATVKTHGAADLLGGGLPSWELSLLHWVNELNQKLRQMEEGTQDDPVQTDPDPQAVQPSLRYRKDKTQSRQKPVFPTVNAVRDLSTGCAVVAVMHYYCPDLLRLEDVCMKDSMSAADSLSNLHFIREFCESCLKSCCPLALEDMLYAPPELESNWLSFLAELLNWFEVRRPEFVQPRDSSDGAKPAVPNSPRKSGSPSIFKKPFLPISSQLSPAGPLTQSTSLSHLENAGKTKTRKPLSRPLSAVSFSIPFGLDSDVDVVMGDPVITRSVSSDQLNPAYTPPEDLTPLSNRPNGPQRASWVTPNAGPPRLALAENGHHREGETGELPTIEEALQIIHNEGKMEPRHHPDGAPAPDGFYLHSPDDGPLPGPMSCSAPSRSGMLYRPTVEPKEPGGRRRSRNASEGSRDDDSVLRDGSVDSEDASEDPPKTPAAGTAASYRTHGKELADSGVKMTSFAERKKKQHGPESPRAGGEAPPAVPPPVAGWVSAADDGPGKSPQLSGEMSELGARLEEKRKAIEAQKKRIEAIFAKHRQRLGKSAFLQLKKGQREDEDGEGAAENGQSPAAADRELAGLTLEEKLARMEEEEEKEKERNKRRPSKDEDNNGGGGETDTPAVPPQVAAATAPLGDYNNAVSKLTAALSSLQSDMQRLSDQQSQLIRKKPAAPGGGRSWVIPPGPKTSTPTRSSREPGRDLGSAASSPSPSRKITSHHHTPPPPKSPHAHRRAQSVPPKSPRPQRTGMSRVLNAPQSVDRIPHLRRVEPWQCKVQTSSSFSIGTDDGPGDAEPFFPSSSAEPTPFSTPAPTPVPRLLPPGEDALSEAGSNEDRQSVFSVDLETRSLPGLARRERPAVGGSSSGAPSECSFESDAPAALFNGNSRGSLIEISLLRGDGHEEEMGQEGQEEQEDSMSDVTEPELRSGLGFFFKDDKVRPEDEMAQRRAALLEKQQKRAEEMKKRKLELEKEKEANRPQWMTIEGWGDKDKGDGQSSTPGTPTGARTPTAEGTPQRRGDFTRQEYERRHQLKVMEDLGKVLRQKPTTVRGVKNQRPKTVFRDDSGISRSPAKGFMDTRLNKQYSHSTMNLSSMANDLSVRKSPSRSHSPARRMSPGRRGSQNGDNWENGSNISSPASIPEYTGPKLYKEPSFKSNKFIIHNAISRCCLAGKVNEPQKNKIVEEMEKSPANHFLILFRDASCQFRAVYTMNPETEEMVRLTGTGPRVVAADMVESIFKYSSDRKQFTAIPSKTMSMSVDAFTIPAHHWQKRPGTPKKLGTPK